MNEQKPRTLSVGGCKGGIGKSSFVANIGMALSQSGKRVVLVDTDIEAPNLHTFVGINYPQKTIDDFIKHSMTGLEDIVLQTPVPNLQLISSVRSIYSLTGINYQQRHRFFSAIKKLDADVVIFDIAAGSRMRVIDYFSVAPVMVMMIEPIPTSLENAYGFLKNLYYRYLLRMFYHDRTTHKMILDVLGDKRSQIDQSIDELLKMLDQRSHEKIEAFRLFISSLNNVYLVLNKAKTHEQKEVLHRFSRVVKRYLMLNLRIGGCLPFEPDMDRSITARTPFIMQYPESNFSESIHKIVMTLF